MQTVNPILDEMFQQRFDLEGNSDTSDFLGMCFGSKKCKERRNARRKRKGDRNQWRKERKRANVAVKLSKAQAIEDGTYKSTGKGALDAVGGLLGNIFGGDKGGAGDAAAYDQGTGAGTGAYTEPTKKDNTMLYIIIGVVVVAVGAYFMMKKK